MKFIHACLTSLLSYNLYPALDSKFHKGRDVAHFVTSVFPGQALDLAPSTHSVNLGGRRGSYMDEASSAKTIPHGTSPCPFGQASLPLGHGPGMSESPSKAVFREADTGALLRHEA